MGKCSAEHAGTTRERRDEGNGITCMFYEVSWQKAEPVREKRGEPGLGGQPLHVPLKTCRSLQWIQGIRQKE